MKYLLFALIIATTVQSQDLLVEYDYRFTRDSTNVSNKATETMQLYISKGQSVFISKIQLEHDSINESLGPIVVPEDGVVKGSEIRAMLPDPQIPYKLTKDYNSATTTLDTKILSTIYSFDEKLPDFKWEIHKDTMTISGYPCKMAKTKAFGREYVAWFTTEIPIQEGPYKFHGLPGLIVKLSDTKNYFDYTLVKLKANVQIHEYSKERNEKKTLKTSRKDYINLVNRVRENPISLLESNGFFVNDPETTKKNIQKRMDRGNNFPEVGLKLIVP